MLKKEIDNCDTNTKRLLIYQELFDNPYLNNITRTTYYKQIYQYTNLDIDYLHKTTEKILEFDTDIVVQNKKHEKYGAKLEEYLIYRLPIKETGKRILYGELVLQYCTANKSMDVKYTIQDVYNIKRNIKKIEESKEIYVLDDQYQVNFSLLGTEKSLRLKCSLYLINNLINRFLNTLDKNTTLEELIKSLRRYISKHPQMFDFRYNNFLTANCQKIFDQLREEMDQYHNKYLDSLENMYSDVDAFQKSGYNYVLLSEWYKFKDKKQFKNNILTILARKLEGSDQLNKYYELDHEINILIKDNLCCNRSLKTRNLMKITFNISIQNNQSRYIEGGLIENYVIITEKHEPIFKEFENEYSFQKPYERTYKYTISQWKTKQFVLAFMYEKLIQIKKMSISCGADDILDMVKDIYFNEERDIYRINIPHDRTFFINKTTMESIIQDKIPEKYKLLRQYLYDFWDYFKEFNQEYKKRVRGCLTRDNKKFHMYHKPFSEEINKVIYIRFSREVKSTYLHIYFKISPKNFISEKDYPFIDNNILKDIKGEYTVDMSIAEYPDAFLSMVNIIQDFITYRDNKDYLKNIKFNLRYNHINDTEPYKNLDQSHSFINFMDDQMDEIELVPDL